MSDHREQRTCERCQFEAP